jgi:hypothetical protein
MNEGHTINNMPENNSKLVHGNSIALARTINSQYADGQIELTDLNGEVYRVRLCDIISLFQSAEYKAVKKHKYYHLSLIQS